MDDNEKGKLANLMDVISNLDQKFIDLSHATVAANDNNMYAVDLLSIAVANRSIQLVNGFKTLVKANNYLCAIPLIRLQLDNAMLFFAINIVKNQSDFIAYILDGKQIKNYKDAKGMKLFDAYLAKALDVYFPGVLSVYQNTSSYIHLSDQHIFATKQLKTSILQPTKVEIGRAIDPFSIDLKINFAATMINVSELVLNVLNQWKVEKEMKPIPQQNTL